MKTHLHQPMHLLMLGALGVVFGDIGTSPLYTLHECLKTGLALNRENIFGVLSLIFWSIMVVVTLKYVTFVMRADNKGEGGILALTALVSEVAPQKLKYGLMLVGLFGAAMFYGDSMITPAISVLSAVEGLEVVNADFSSLVIPIALVIISVLFAIQKRGTASIGAYFGPTMLAWFSAIGLLGVYHIAKNPGVLLAVSPWYAIHFVLQAPGTAFIVLASAFLALTGGEALYADMGHFGKTPIQRAWLMVVFPCLALCYFGQGAMVLHHPETLKNPFYAMAPHWALIPLVLLATAATVIASQAVISGAFSMTKQAVQLGYLPRIKVVHTSSQEIGQIFVPFINGVLFVAVLFLVLFFKSSDNLAAAYGIAVASTMLLTTVFMFFVTNYIWKWSKVKTLAVSGMLVCVDLAFVSANAGKIVEGGWFPIAAGCTLFLLMTTWKTGRKLLLGEISKKSLPLKTFMQGLFHSEHKPAHVEGTAVFLCRVPETTPVSLLHNLKHNHVLHENNIFLSIETAAVPFIKNSDKVEIEDLGHHCYVVRAKVGFKETSNIPNLLSLVQGHIDCWNYDEMMTSFFLNRESLLVGRQPGMMTWRKKLFALLSRNATTAADFFHLPSNRVVEMGSQITI